MRAWHLQRTEHIPTYGYDIFNRMISATPAGSSAATLAYDPAGRLHEIANPSTTTRFLYDGAQMIAEYNASNVLQRRYVFGPGLDEPLVWYEGSGTSDRRTLVQDERGSVLAVTNASGAATTINSYDEFGQRGAGNTGRFQYTGQAWLNEAGIYHYRARAYVPALGRFAQTDPIGFGGGMNLYAYVANDPVNFSDPLGFDRVECPPTGPDEWTCPDTPATGCRSNQLCNPDDWNRFLAWLFEDSSLTSALFGEGGTGEGSDLASRQCPSDPVLMNYLSTVGMTTASFLNAQARQSGRNWEGGGAIGYGRNGFVATPVAYSRGAMTLSTQRGVLSNSGISPAYDWHTHVDAGVNTAVYGFSLGVNGGDIYSTALTSPSFRGSFVVMRDRILYMPRAMARTLVDGPRVPNPGIRCR